MTNTAKPVAKSLHTITVIVQVARHIRETCSYTNDNRRNNPTNAAAIEEALIVLGLANRADPYGLAAAAAKQLGN